MEPLKGFRLILVGAAMLGALLGPGWIALRCAAALIIYAFIVVPVNVLRSVIRRER